MRTSSLRALAQIVSNSPPAAAARPPISSVQMRLCQLGRLDAGSMAPKVDLCARKRTSSAFLTLNVIGGHYDGLLEHVVMIETTAIPSPFIKTENCFPKSGRGALRPDDI
jgi:hypothetical protein